MTSCSTGSSPPSSFPRSSFPGRTRTPGCCSRSPPTSSASAPAQSARRIFGHFGDRIGRKRTLVITMLTMGAGTVGIGLIPPYHVIGPVSAFLLVACRLLQGLGVGGEWGGANLLAMESGSPRRRGFLTSFPQAGAMLGLASANLAVLVMTTVLPGDEFVRWGWRPIALYIAVAGMVGLAAVITLQRRNAAMTTLVDRTPGLQAGAVVDDDEWPKVSFTAAR